MGLDTNLKTEKDTPMSHLPETLVLLSAEVLKLTEELRAMENAEERYRLECIALRRALNHWVRKYFELMDCPLSEKDE